MTSDRKHGSNGCSLHLLLLLLEGLSKVLLRDLAALEFVLSLRLELAPRAYSDGVSARRSVFRDRDGISRAVAELESLEIGVAWPFLALAQGLVEVAHVLPGLVSWGPVAVRHLPLPGVLCFRAVSRVELRRVQEGLLVLNEVDLDVAVVHAGASFLREGWRVARRLDHEGAGVAGRQVLDGQVHCGVGISELNFLYGAALVLLEWAEGDGIVWVGVRARAAPCGVAGLGARAVLAARHLNLGLGVEGLGVVALETEVESSFDALAALEIGRVGDGGVAWAHG